MDSRKSKKTRSYGEAPSRSKVEIQSRSAGSTSSSSSRPQPRDRTYSEPVIPQVSPTKECHDARSPKAASPTTRRHHTSTPAEYSRNGLHPPPLAIPELNFAVAGAETSGKSTFIRCALDLKKPATSPISSKKMSLEGDLFLINLVEVPIDMVQVVADQVRWPKLLEEEVMPRIDGVLAIYDVTSRQSLKEITRLLVTPPLSAASSPRTRAMTTSNFSTSLNSSHSHHTKAKHGRATSELIGSAARPVNAASPPPQSPRSLGPGSPREFTTQDSNGNASLESYPSVRRSSKVAPKTTRENAIDEDKVLEHAQRVPTTPPAGLGLTSEISFRSSANTGVSTPTAAASTFLDIHQEDSEETEPEDDNPDSIPEGNIQVNRGGGGEGFSLDELIDRLLSVPMSKSDAKFASIFLCLYRKFAAPAQLLSGIIRRFETLNVTKEPHLIKTASQLRYLGILAQWVAEYPGDFAHPLTRQQMTTFIAQLTKVRIFAIAATEMGCQIDVVYQDDDTDWACSDTSRGRASTLKSFSSVVSMQEAVAAMLRDEKESVGSDVPDRARTEDSSRNHSVKHSKTPSTASSTGRSGSHSAVSFSVLLSSLESAQRAAELLTPATRTLLTKEQWHSFMELGTEDIARELTRIDWIMYISIRPRDLIRHVTLTAEQKERCNSLAHVHRMINHFNHVAFWVANMILLREKAKHRARALEKFMGIAWKLRQMNNYNSLGAVIAGINGTAVHRLAQTRDLVPQQAQKEFMRLEILMGTQKSHFAYRLAWENTTSERLPFLPLHRRDLVSAEEGNRTFIGDHLDRINWRKFEVMGEVIVGIQRSQETHYPNITRNLDIQRLVLDGRFSKDDDELYERSVQLEGPGTGENTRRRFNWFQR